MEGSRLDQSLENISNKRLNQMKYY
uniref:Uncharacterized protein n=1 Tax=Arundo donax TaxID=35708 RepID=A0A0A8Z3X5_ARUDO